MGESDAYFIKAALNAHTYLDLENKERLPDKNMGFGARQDCFRLNTNLSFTSFVTFDAINLFCVSFFLTY